MLPSVQVYSRKTIQMSNQNHCDGLILFLTNENPRDWHGRLYCVVIEICTCYFVVLPCNKIASANFDKYTIQGWQKSNTTSSEMLQSNRPRCECAHTQEQKKHKEIIKEPAWNNKQRSQQQKLCTMLIGCVNLRQRNYWLQAYRRLSLANPDWTRATRRNRPSCLQPAKRATAIDLGCVSLHPRTEW